MMIDREKVIKGITHHKLGMCDMSGKICPYWNEDDGCSKKMLEDVLSLLKEQKAKTGHWIEKEDYNLDTYYDCSVCGESWTTIDGTPWENGMNYCPHCGAKMEGR